MGDFSESQEGTAKKKGKILSEWWHRTRYQWDGQELTEFCRPVFEKLLAEEPEEEYRKYARLLLEAAAAAGITRDEPGEFTLDELTTNAYTDWEAEQLYLGDRVKVLLPAWYQNGRVLEQGSCQRLDEERERRRNERNGGSVMAVQRIIGVDFGTSTSVIRVKRYENGKPAGVGEKLETGSVVFNGMYPMVPTLIQRVGDSTYYGYDAQIAKKKAVLYQGFKVKLESEIPEEREEARALTEEFLGYLARCYREQSEGGHLGEPQDEEKTLVSYPVKWSDETKSFMVEAAARAGFPNVEGLDEARAAIHAAALQSEEYLKKQRYLQPGKVSTILLIDMGAGTTDLVLCRYTPGEAPKNEILCTWPKAGEVLFGGQEVDGSCKNFVRSRLPEEAAPLLKNFDNSRFKAWKENLVSPALLRGDVVDGFSDLDSSLEMMGVDVEDYGLNRKELERFAGEYLRGLPQLVRGCIREAGIRPAEVELVILTGGHSQWYFTQESFWHGRSRRSARRCCRRLRRIQERSF